MAGDAPSDDASASPDPGAPSWGAADATSLLPQHIAVSRPLRAYERKPASPYTRGRFRVGKLWKRTGTYAPSRKPMVASLASGNGGGSPMQVVKRLRGGMEDRVDMQWERVGSPVKKSKGAERIVTRSMRQDGLVELSGENQDGAEAVASATLQSAEEIKAVLEVDDEELALDASPIVGEEDGWEDEQESNGSRNGILAGILDEPSGATKLAANAELGFDVPAERPVEEDSDGAGELNGECASLLDATSAQQSVDALPAVLRAHPSMSGPLPAGFVSPVKRHRSVSKRLSMAADRRRTLPGTFAPNTTAAADHVPHVKPLTPLSEVPGMQVTASAQPDIAMSPGKQDEVQVDVEVQHDTTPGDDEWEDVDDKDTAESDSVSLPEAGEDADITGSGLQLLLYPTTSGGEHAEDAPADPEPTRMSISIETTVKLGEDLNSPLAQAVAIQEQLIAHELSPRSNPSPRRSPRRKSVSPAKQTATPSTAEKSGLPSVASLRQEGVPFHNIQQALFLTMFGSGRGSSDPHRGDHRDHPSTIKSRALVDALPHSLERSSSAPPEPPRLSPHKAPRPRVSDDTALLQAFIKRANQSKTSRRSSIAKRESLENRRESDTVRRALASPAKEDVLADLDPNASPRKAAVDDAVPVAESITSPSRETIAQSEENPRRSLRRTQRRTASAALPNKISLRGSTEPFVLRRGEAHELERVTRANTRKNKTGCVLPNLRLIKLAAEKGADCDGIEVVTITESVNGDGKRKIQWDQTLNYYSDAPPQISPPTSDDEEADADKQLVSELTDASSAAQDAMQIDSTPSIQEQAIELSARFAGSAPKVAVPAAETPSKPKRKIRKLAAPRTAAAPGPAVVESLPTAVPALAMPSAAEPKVNPLKRSRIATPAKPTALPVPTATLDKQAPLGSATPKLIPRKRPVPSRLPAPASTVATQPQDLKPTPSLLASPPKKKSSSSLSVKGASAGAKVAKLDFGTSSLTSFAKSDCEPLGLSASPAKRAGKVFALSKVDRFEEDEGRLMGMGSPAKKRGRRV
ncbi:hypothetical protein LTR95_011701 [Oleoguttula sp. CCFEE 5521]